MSNRTVVLILIEVYPKAIKKINIKDNTQRIVVQQLINFQGFNLLKAIKKQDKKALIIMCKHNVQDQKLSMKIEVRLKTKNRNKLEINTSWI